VVPVRESGFESLGWHGGWLAMDVIGSLYNGREFICLDCIAQHRYPGGLDSVVTIRRENIGIYSQECHRCGTLIVDGVKKFKSNKPLNLYEKAKDGIPSFMNKAKLVHEVIESLTEEVKHLWNLKFISMNMTEDELRVIEKFVHEAKECREKTI
jgi:hypothetical protein